MQIKAYELSLTSQNEVVGFKHETALSREQKNNSQEKQSPVKKKQKPLTKGRSKVVDKDATQGTLFLDLSRRVSVEPPTKYSNN